jgi:hypothetical protein
MAGEGVDGLPDLRVVAVDADDVDGAHERGVDGTRDHQSHADAVGREIEAEHFADAAQPELGGAVRRMER